MQSDSLDVVRVTVVRPAKSRVERHVGFVDRDTRPGDSQSVGVIETHPRNIVVAIELLAPSALLHQRWATAGPTTVRECEAGRWNIGPGALGRQQGG